MLKNRKISITNWKITNFFALAVVVALGIVLSSCSSGDEGGIGGPSNVTSGSFTVMSQRDTDGDGSIDLADPDDDNDSTPDVSDMDDDNDGIMDHDEEDSDGDGTINDHDDDYVEVEGAVTSVGDGSFVVYGYEILVDENTRYESEDGASFGFDDITVGMRLEVEGIWTDSQTVLAREIESEDDDDHGENHDDDDEYDDDDGYDDGGDDS